MNGLAQLPELPVDSTAGSITTSSATSPSDSTAMGGDGGTFDQLVANVASAPQRNPSPPSHSASPDHDDSDQNGPDRAERDRAERDRAHETQPTTDSTALADSANHAIMLLAAGGQSPSIAAHGNETNGRRDAHADGEVFGTAAASAAANQLRSVSADLSIEHDPATEADSKSNGSVLAKQATANLHTGKSGDSLSVLTVTAHPSSNAQTSRLQTDPMRADPAHTISKATNQAEHGAPSVGIGAHRATNSAETGQSATELSQGGHDSHATTTTSPTTPVVTGEHNIGAASPAATALTASRESSSHSGELPGVASQLLNVIAPLRQTPAGGQTLTIALHPAGLGEVRVSLTVTDGQTTVRLIASSPEGADAIRGSLGSLESGLSDGRQQAHVFLGNELSGNGQQSPSGDRAGGDGQRSATADSTTTNPSRVEIERSNETLSTQTTTRLINMRI